MTVPSVRMLGRRARVVGFAVFTVGMAGTGCMRVPCPLAPSVAGSIGMPHRGVLTEPAELASEGSGWKLLRDNERGYGLPRFVHALERAAESVAVQRPGGTLIVGDLSAQKGGSILPHLSHRNGRDADLVFFALTVDGVPVESPGFVHYGADGLAWDESGRRFLRFDVEREWLLVKSLLEDEEARVQWMFISRAAEGMLLEWAHARGEPLETIARAQGVMAQPHPGGEHDDHIHVRTACSLDDQAHGCEPNGPVRAWLATPAPSRLDATSVEALVVALLGPMDGVANASDAPAPLPSAPVAPIPIASNAWW